ncbi:adenosine deaminase [Photobacterium sp. CCB-ST2H9]|uniref:adenosine deaminase n=1 Tax=unclassified Photobacterium TaxID=2628852 RepID=UPI00200423D1|nr:adenosine deaminase [Photobacterium sp. CCB-ST2H9]UTM58376.1 adenosine deaminase [Photobacterium sp. CCB-ST2H9]
MNVIKTLIVAGAAISAVGCSTILTDENQRINVVSSSDKKFTVEVDGIEQTAPGIITVKKENKDKTLLVTSEGCKQQVALNKEVEPTFFVNILSGGAFGSTTDFASEKMWRYQDTLQINCQ